MKFYKYFKTLNLEQFVSDELDPHYSEESESNLIDFRDRTVKSYSILLQKLLDKRILEKKDIYEILSASTTYDQDE